MFLHRFPRLKKQQAIITLVLSFSLLIAIGLTTVDWTDVLNENATAQIAGGEPPAPATTNDGLSFKKIVTAPVRLIARMFRRSDNATVAKTIPTNPIANNTPEISSAIEREAATIFDQAIDLHSKKQLDNAIAKLTAVVGMQPNNSEAYNLLGVCYDEKGQYQAAQDEYRKAVKLEPINARFLNNLGYSFYLAGNDKQAIKWYQKALKFTPSDKRVQNNLGLAFGRRGEFAKAKEQFTTAVGEHGALLNMGFIYANQGKYQQAIESLESALKLQPNSLTAMSNLAQIYDRVGRAREAEVLTAQYKKLSATNSPVANQTAQSTEKKNEQEEDDR